MKNLLFTLALCISFISFSQKTENHLVYFNKGNEKSEAKDYYGAIYEYTKSIEAKLPYIYPPSHINRALCKAKIGDLKSAFEDINYVIETLDAAWGDPYYWRGIIKLEYSKDYYGAIADFLRAIDYDNKDGRYVYFLGLAKEEIGDINGACNDWKKAVKLGYQDASKLVEEKCN